MKNSGHYLVLTVAMLLLMCILTSCNSTPPSQRSTPISQANSSPLSTATSLPSPISTPLPIPTLGPLPSSTPFPPAIVAETVNSDTSLKVHNIDVIGHAKIAAARGVAVQQGYAYIAAGIAMSGLPVVDLSHLSLTNPASSIRHAPGLAMPLRGGGSTNIVVVSGTHAYLGDNLGLHVMDISNPVTPVETSFYRGIEDVQDLQVIGNLAYVVDWKSLHILDVSDSKKLVELSHNQSVDAHATVVEGRYAYIAAGSDGGLQVVDIANAANPVEVGRYPLPALGWDVVVRDGYVYASWNWRGSQQQSCKDCDSGVRIFAIMTEGKLTEIGNYRVHGDLVAGLAIDGTHLYIAAGEKGVRVIDVSNPAQPIEVGYFDTPGTANAATVAGTLVYVADGDEGLWILKDTSPNKSDQ